MIRSEHEARLQELQNQIKDTGAKNDELTRQLSEETEKLENSLMREEDLRGNILILEARRKSCANAA